LDASDPQVELLVTRPDGSASLLVRVTSLELGLGRVTPRELPALKPLTDRLVRSDRRVALLRPAAPVSLGGLRVIAISTPSPTRPPGSRPLTCTTFLFQGPTMLALVSRLHERPA